MAGAVFWFQTYDKDVFSSRPVDLDAWRYALKAGGIYTAKCINESHFPISLGGDMDFEIIGTTIQEFTDWINDHSAEKMAIFDTQWTAPEGAIPLSQLNHKEIDWYIFGAGNGVPKDLPGQYVYLPQSGTGALHSVHIASAVMLRRWEEIN